MTYIQCRPITNFLLAAIKSIIFEKFRFLINSDKVKILDLFAGSGSFSFFLSTMFKSSYIICVEKQIHLCAKINKLMLKNSNVRSKVICTDVFRLNLSFLFDIIIIDPPYKFLVLEKLLKIILKQNWYSPTNLIIARHPNKDLIIPNGFQLLHVYNRKYNYVFFLKRVYE